MEGNKGLLTKTPKDLPFSAYERFSMDATLTKDGVLTEMRDSKLATTVKLSSASPFAILPVQVEGAYRGDYSRTGFRGHCRRRRYSSLDDTSKPFWVTYKYHRVDYGDWPNHQITLPFPYFLLPQLSPEEEKVDGAVPLGEVKELTYSVRVTLPQGFVPAVPEAVAISNSFMKYDSTYKLSGSILEGTRHRVIQPDIAPSDRKSYVTFNKTVFDDETRWIVLTTNTLPPRFQSSNPDVQKLLTEAYQSMQAGAPHPRLNLWKRPSKSIPKQANAWLLLGLTRSGNPAQYQSALDAFRRAIALEPTNMDFYSAMASLQWAKGKLPDAVQTWRQCVKASPGDLRAKRALTNTLVATEDFAGAEPLLKELSDANFQPPVTYDLAQTYLHLGEREKGMELLRQMLDADPHGETLIRWHGRSPKRNTNCPTHSSTPSSPFRRQKNRAPQNLALFDSSCPPFPRGGTRLDGSTSRWETLMRRSVTWPLVEDLAVGSSWRAPRRRLCEKGRLWTGAPRIFARVGVSQS